MYLSDDHNEEPIRLLLLGGGDFMHEISLVAALDGAMRVVCWTSDAAAVADMVRQARPDFAVLDWNGEAPALLRALDALRAGGERPTVIVLVEDAQRDGQVAFAAGADVLIDRDELLSKLLPALQSSAPDRRQD